MTQEIICAWFMKHMGRYYTLVQIADGTGISKDRVSKACNLLCRFGFLVRTYTDHRQVRTGYLRYMMPK